MFPVVMLFQADLFFPLTDLSPIFKCRMLPQRRAPQTCSLTLSFLGTKIGNGEAESPEESREEARTEAREPREACRVLGGCLGGGRLRAGASGEKAGRGMAAPAPLRAVVPGQAAAFPLSKTAAGQTSGKAQMILKLFSHCPAHVSPVWPQTRFLCAPLKYFVVPFLPRFSAGTPPVLSSLPDVPVFVAGVASSTPHTCFISFAAPSPHPSARSSFY